MTARAGRAITATGDHRHPRRRHRDQDLQRFCPAVVVERFEIAPPREPPEPRRFGLAILGMAGTWTGMAMAWAASDPRITR